LTPAPYKQLSRFFWKSKFFVKNVIRNAAKLLRVAAESEKLSQTESIHKLPVKAADAMISVMRGWLSEMVTGQDTRCC
jgi:hypothetical protein